MTTATATAAATIDAETETQILSIGDEFLPPVARLVRDGAEITTVQLAEYAEWLASQIAEAGVA